MRLGIGSNFKHNVQMSFDVTFGEVESLAANQSFPRFAQSL